MRLTYEVDFIKKVKDPLKIRENWIPVGIRGVRVYGGKYVFSPLIKMDLVKIYSDSINDADITFLSVFIYSCGFNRIKASVLGLHLQQKLYS